MARTIESPGVEIKERDLSLNATLPVGTNIFVQGFASQGPTDELVNVTSMSEYEQIYGIPSNAAERYFYHTSKQILQSPGNLLVTRLPYGSGSGNGYGSKYSALLYPVIGRNGMDMWTAVSAVGYEAMLTINNSNSGTDFSLSTDYRPVVNGSLSITLTGWESPVIGGGGYIAATFNETAVSGILSSTLVGASGTYNNYTGDITLDLMTSAISAGGVFGSYSYYDNVSGDMLTSYVDATSLKIGQPTQIELSEAEYTQWQAGQINWAVSGNGTISSTISTAGGAGIVIINKVKTSVDDNYGGYYVALTDNSQFGDTTFDAITSIKYEDTSTNDWAVVPTTRLDFSLTGTSIGDSISEDVETIPSWEFDDTVYNDCLTVGLFKIRQTLYSQQNTIALERVLQEGYVGSLDATRKWTPNGPEESFFLGTIINSDSVFMQIMINPYIASKSGAWGSPPSKTVRVKSGAKSSYALGPVIIPTDDQKVIGNLPEKIERSLRLAENKEQIPIDIVCDGGLSTIWSAVRSPNAVADADDTGTYVDTDYLYGVFEKDPAGGDTDYLADQSTGTSCRVQDNWETIFGLLNQFCGETRKDCLLIVDPLRHIFVQGEDYKVLDDTTKNFSAHVYWTMKNLNAATNSNYACTYGNWVKAYDNEYGDFVWLPFSGYEANIMANVDANLQPWYAAAGLNNGVIRNIVDIAVNPTQKQRDLLYRINVNPVVFFPGDGYVVWGQKTLQKKPSAFDRINVRRLFLVLEKATLAVMRYFVFEPNTVFTRTRVVNVLTPIFEIPKNNEGVYDYLIVCDERNNTPAVCDKNELVCDIYLKPVRIAEYILVNFIATRTDQDFTELL